jgi:hypothetical protein
MKQVLQTIQTAMHKTQRALASLATPKGVAYVAGAALVLLIVGMTSQVVFAQAGGTAQEIGNELARQVAKFMLILATYAIDLTIFSLEYLLKIAAYNDFSNAMPVTLGWFMMRDIANMFFVVALLVIAFSTILGLDNYEWKRALVKLVIAAVLINFSKLIAQLIIDAAHVFTMTFLNAIVATAGGNLINMFGLPKLFQIAPNLQQSPNFLIEILGSAFLMLMFATMVMLTIGAYCILLLIRMVILWVLMILSPLAYLLGALPQTKKYAQEYWGEFVKYVTVAPMMVFFLWLAFASFGQGDIAQSLNISPANEANQAISGSLGTTVANTAGNASVQVTSLSLGTSWGNIANMLIAMVFLLYGLRRVSQSGIEGASRVVGAVNRFGGQVATYASGLAFARYAHNQAKPYYGKAAVAGGLLAASGGLLPGAAVLGVGALAKKPVSRTLRKYKARANTQLNNLAIARNNAAKQYELEGGAVNKTLAWALSTEDRKEALVKKEEDTQKLSEEVRKMEYKTSHRGEGERNMELLARVEDTREKKAEGKRAALARARKKSQDTSVSDTLGGGVLVPRALADIGAGGKDKGAISTGESIAKKRAEAKRAQEIFDNDGKLTDAKAQAAFDKKQEKTYRKGRQTERDVVAFQQTGKLSEETKDEFFQKKVQKERELEVLKAEVAEQNKERPPDQQLDYKKLDKYQELRAGLAQINEEEKRVLQEVRAYIRDKQAYQEFKDQFIFAEGVAIGRVRDARFAKAQEQAIQQKETRKKEEVDRWLKNPKLARKDGEYGLAALSDEYTGLLDSSALDQAFATELDIEDSRLERIRLAEKRDEARARLGRPPLNFQVKEEDQIAEKRAKEYLDGKEYAEQIQTGTSTVQVFNDLASVPNDFAKELEHAQQIQALTQQDIVTASDFNSKVLKKLGFTNEKEVAVLSDNDARYNATLSLARLGQVSKPQLEEILKNADSSFNPEEFNLHNISEAQFQAVEEVVKQRFGGEKAYQRAQRREFRVKEDLGKKGLTYYGGLINSSVDPEGKPIFRYNLKADAVRARQLGVTNIYGTPGSQIDTIEGFVNGDKLDIEGYRLRLTKKSNGRITGKAADSIQDYIEAEGAGKNERVQQLAEFIIELSKNHTAEHVENFVKSLNQKTIERFGSLTKKNDKNLKAIAEKITSKINKEREEGLRELKIYYTE